MWKLVCIAATFASQYTGLAFADDLCPKPNEYYDSCPSSCPARTCGIDDRLLDCVPELKPGDPDCPAPACRCERGYYRDNNGNCVVWEDCPQPKENEVWSPCGDFGCDKRNCIQIDQPDICTDPIKCIGGYVCMEGYLRARNGTCIPRDQCYDDLCPKPNEYYDSCPSSCPARTCGIDDRLLDCVPELKPGDPDCPASTCRCKRGYYRDNNGNCVVWEDCRK